MKFRFRIVNGDNETFSEWTDDNSTQVAGTKEPPSPVKAVSELRRLYPDASFSLEQEETPEVSGKERAEIEARWLNRKVT